MLVVDAFACPYARIRSINWRNIFASLNWLLVLVLDDVLPVVEDEVPEEEELLDVDVVPLDVEELVEEVLVEAVLVDLS